MELAGYNRLHRVTISAYNGKDYELELKVPVFTDALEFQRDSANLLKQSSKINLLYEVSGLTPPLKTEEMSDEKYEALREEFATRLKNMPEETTNEILEAVKERESNIMSFIRKWLPRVCDKFKEVPEDRLDETIGNLLRTTGTGVSSPILEAILKLNGMYINTEDEDLEPLPF